MESKVYRFEQGLRHVVPYQHAWEAFAKKRWFGKTLLEVMLTEFRGMSRDYYVKAIRDGGIRVNGEISGPDTILKPNTKLSHSYMRTEPPVLGEPIHVIHDDKDILVVNKPGTIPVHTCGGYNKNTIVSILQDEIGQKVYAAHRLDRMTSGVLILGKSAQAVNHIRQQFDSSAIQKVYVARVLGYWDRDELTVQAPIKCVDPRKGVHIVHEDGKHAETVFRRHSYNAVDDVSIVECLPKTGRTHQIRVHLQHCGFPIDNDPCYGKITNAGKSQREEDSPSPPEEGREGGRGKSPFALHLHAHQYLTPERTFVAPLPEWAVFKSEDVTAIDGAREG